MTDHEVARSRSGLAAVRNLLADAEPRHIRWLIAALWVLGTVGMALSVVAELYTFAPIFAAGLVWLGFAWQSVRSEMGGDSNE